ncbi:MAG: hypothetical protein WBO73_17990 [Gammaproteobacteria bacterium]
MLTTQSWAESKRIEVYPLSQSYWDIKAGETLGGIVSKLLPANHYLQDKLTREIIALNPEVFPNGDPDRMLANRRLWLPNAVKTPSPPSNASEYTIQSFQWGSIKRSD